MVIWGVPTACRSFQVQTIVASKRGLAWRKCETRQRHILSASKRASGSNINQIQQLQMHIVRKFSHPPKSFLSKMTLSQESLPYLKEYTCNIFVYLQQSPFRTIVLDHKVAAPYKPEYHNDIYILEARFCPQPQSMPVFPHFFHRPTQSCPLDHHSQSRAPLLH